MKKFVILVITCAVIFSIGSLTTVFGNDIHSYKEGQIKRARVESKDPNAFYNLVKTSDANIYDMTKNWRFCEAYSTGESKGVEITHLDYSKVMYVKDEEKYSSKLFINGELIGDTDSTKVAFFGKSDNIKNILAKNNIDCNVKDYVILEVPLCARDIIRVDTDKGYYYITFVLNNAYAGTDTEYSNFVFKVYNTEKFLKILSLQDAEVLVNGKKISNDNYHAKMQGNVAQISLRAMLEAFGSEVTWKDEEQAIMFTCGEDRYKFRLNEYGVTEHSDILVSTAGGEYEPVFWRAEKLYYKMIDDRVIIWEGMAVDRFSKIFEKRAKMDYDKLTIDFVDI